jgi:DNA-directed RNA polymerase subunit RPC12/RpoP
MSTCEICGKEIIDDDSATITVKSKDGRKKQTITCQDCSLNFCRNLTNILRGKKEPPEAR